MMKALLVSRHFPNIFGGVSDYTYNLSKALTQKDMEVYVLTSKDERIIKEMEGNVKVLPLLAGWNLMDLTRIAKEIKKINPDWISIQYVPNMYSHYGIPVYIALFSILLRIMRFKLITTFHEIAIRLDFRKPKHLGIAVLQRLIAYAMCMASHKIIVSIEHYRKMLGIFSKKICKIPIGSNIVPIDVSNDEKRELRRQIAPSDEIIISTFGANPRRNDLMLRVIKRLKEENVAVKLLIIGNFPGKWIEGIKTKAVELNIEDAVYFTGFLQSKDVYRCLSISDLFVIFEFVDDRGWGGISIKNTSLAAAYAARLPIIGNKGDMTDDFFSHRENIILINSLNEEAVSKEIKELLANPVLIEALKRGATETFETKLSWSVIAQKHIEICMGGKVLA